MLGEDKVVILAEVNRCVFHYTFPQALCSRQRALQGEGGVAGSPHALRPESLASWPVSGHIWGTWP